VLLQGCPLGSGGSPLSVSAGRTVGKEKGPHTPRRGLSGRGWARSTVGNLAFLGQAGSRRVSVSIPRTSWVPECQCVNHPPCRGQVGTLHLPLHGRAVVGLRLQLFLATAGFFFGVTRRVGQGIVGVVLVVQNGRPRSHDQSPQNRVAGDVKTEGQCCCGTACGLAGKLPHTTTGAARREMAPWLSEVPPTASRMHGALLAAALRCAVTAAGGSNFARARPGHPLPGGRPYHPWCHPRATGKSPARPASRPGAETSALQ
jgi:hypothetical protein